jgi:hypothetical protein
LSFLVAQNEAVTIKVLMTSDKAASEQSYWRSASLFQNSNSCWHLAMALCFMELISCEPRPKHVYGRLRTASGITVDVPVFDSDLLRSSRQTRLSVLANSLRAEMKVLEKWPKCAF